LGRPIYEEFFRTVREVNRSLPNTRHLRVLLGDPPVDWAKVTRWADLDPWLAERDRYPAELVRREVIEKQRRALLIFGSAHIFRVPMDESVVHLIRNVINVFTIATPISMPTAKIYERCSRTSTRGQFQALPSSVEPLLAKRISISITHHRWSSKTKRLNRSYPLNGVR